MEMETEMETETEAAMDRDGHRRVLHEFFPRKHSSTTHPPDKNR